MPQWPPLNTSDHLIGCPKPGSFLSLCNTRKANLNIKQSKLSRSISGMLNPEKHTSLKTGSYELINLAN